MLNQEPEIYDEIKVGAYGPVVLSNSVRVKGHGHVGGMLAYYDDDDCVTDCDCKKECDCPTKRVIILYSSSDGIMCFGGAFSFQFDVSPNNVRVATEEDLKTRNWIS